MNTLDPAVTMLVLGSALLHAAWNALVKTGGDRLSVMSTIHLTWGVIGGAGIFLVPWPLSASWPFILLSVVLHWLYIAGLLTMYREGDLSLVYPLARGSAPLMLAVLSALWVGEVLTILGWVGVTGVSLGIGVLTLGGRRRAGGDLDEAGAMAALRKRKAHRRAVWSALFTGMTIVGYTLVDGVGVRRSGSPLGYAAWLFLLQGGGWGLGWLVWLLLARRPAGGVPLRRRLPTELMAGVMSLAAYGMVIWAMNLAPLAVVSALRETGVIFAALIGTVLLKEPFGRHRIAAAAIVALGVVLLNWPQ